MGLKMSYTFTCLIIVIISCARWDKTSQRVKRETKKDKDAYITFVAKSENGLGRYFVFRENNSFVLLENADCSKCKEKYYSGTYTSKTDSIILDYYHDWKPLQMALYLLKDSSNLFLDYPSQDSKTHQRLKLQFR
jgi:hypothetical protein